MGHTCGVLLFMQLPNLDDIRQEIARRKMIDFAKFMKSNYIVNWHHELICKKLDQFLSGEIKRLMIFIPPQFGKQLAHDTPILTPNGWVKHGDLRPGDYVYGRSGQPVKVLGISEDSLTEYEVTFSDGGVIECHGNHEWAVWDRFLRRERVVDTNYLFNYRDTLQIDCNVRLQSEEQKIIPKKLNLNIISVKKTDNPKPGRCIQVEGGIYLAGETLIPTHNSELTSRLFPAYVFGKNPDTKLVLASYSASMAESFNRDCQRYIDTPEYAKLFPNTRLQAAGSNGKYIRNAERFDIVDRQGFLKTVGVGGSLTGTPADMLIIDDPVKDMQDAKSAIMQQSTWEWFLSVAETRIHNNTGILIIQTRWDINDLSGKLIDAMNNDVGDKWTILSLPAVKENDGDPEDPRKVGESLWEVRHSIERLRMIEKKSKRVYQSLYQQNPMPVQAGGECYKEFDIINNTGDYTSPEIDNTPNPWLYDPELPLHFSFDFNVNPYMSCGVKQVHKIMVDDKPYYRVVKIEEICLRSPRNTTKGVCRHIREKYGYRHKSTSYVYGDPNGMKEDTRSEKGHNDYLIIKQELAQFKPAFRVATKAPAVATRIGFMNAIFSFSIPELEYFIDKKCTNTTNDYLYIKEESDGSKQKIKAIDPITGINSERYGHCFIGETLIETHGGQKRIDEVKVGDFVLTRKGYKEVEKVFNNGIKDVVTYRIRGIDITCTSNHNFFCMDIGEGDNPRWEFKEIQSIKSAFFYVLVKDRHIYEMHAYPKVVSMSSGEVYDLQIESQHEYFANGVLVHNCSDHDEYFFCAAFPNIYGRYQTGRVTSPIINGKRQTRHGARNY